jgi:hypothetical protein
MPLIGLESKALATHAALLRAVVLECPGADSNRYAFRHHPLKMACLPISPPGQNFSPRSALRTRTPHNKHGADGARTRDLSSDSRVL